MTLVAWGVAAVLGVLAAIHAYWALGGRRGFWAAVPEVEGAPLFVPGVAITLLVAGLLGVSALLVLDRAGAGAALFSAAVAKWGTWLVALAFLGRAIGDFRYVGFFKRRRGTRFARLDTRVYSPLVFALGAGAAAVALGSG